LTGGPVEGWTLLGTLVGAVGLLVLQAAMPARD